MSQKPLTSSRILQAARTPTYDVLVGGDGSLKVQVSGVPKPFAFIVSAAVVRDAAPFGKPTRESAMRLAYDLAGQQCRIRGFLGVN